MFGYITTVYNRLTRPNHLANWQIRSLLSACCRSLNGSYSGKELLDQYELQPENAFEVLIERGIVTFEQIKSVVNRDHGYGYCPDHFFKMLMKKSKDGQPDNINWMRPITKYKAQLLADTGYSLNGKAKDCRLLISWRQIYDLKMLNFLIELGFDVHAVRSYGNLLHVMDEEDILRHLINLGVDLEATDNNGLTPVCVNPSLLTILKPGSVNTKVTDRKGNSILQRYFLNDENADVFKVVLLLGVDVNHQNNKGETILHMLMDRIYNPNDPEEFYQWDDIVMGKYLDIFLAAGADPTLKTEPRSVEKKIQKFRRELEDLEEDD